MGAGDEFALKLEYIIQKGSFDSVVDPKTKKEIKTNFLGWLAHTYKGGWLNLMDFLDSKLATTDMSPDDKYIFETFLRNKLRPMTEMTDLEFPKVSDLDADGRGRSFLLEVLMPEVEFWANEARPLNLVGVVSQSMLHNVWHIFIADQFGDSQYSDAVHAILDNYLTLSEAYRDLKPRYDNGEFAVESNEYIFCSKYGDYQKIVDRKHRIFFEECKTWNNNTQGMVINREAGPNKGKLSLIGPINELKSNFGPLPGFMSGSPVFDEDVYKTQTPLEWARAFYDFKAENQDAVMQYIKDNMDKPKLIDTWKNLCRIADMVFSTDKYHVGLIYFPMEEDIIPFSETPERGRLLYRSTEPFNMHDGQDRVSLGQHMYRALTFPTMFANKPNLAVINTAMNVETDITEAGRAYASSQQTYTIQVERGIWLAVTFYGKACGIQSIIEFSRTPDEDNGAGLDHNASGFLTINTLYGSDDWNRTTDWGGATWQTKETAIPITFILLFRRS